jgi:hypothetical protein
MPASLSTGDLLLMLVETSDPSVTISSGWIAAPNTPVTGTTFATTLSVYYQWYSGSAPARTVSAASDHTIAQIFALRGLNKSGNPFNFTASTLGNTTSSGVFPGGTTRVDDSLILIASANSRDTTSVLIYSAWANADLGSVTQRVQNNSSVGDGGGIVLTTGTKATKGAFGDTTATVSVSSSQWVGWVGAISANLIDDFAPGALTLAGNDAFLGFLDSDAGTLTLTGGDALLKTVETFDADDEGLTLTGGDANLIEGTVLLGDSEPLTLTGEDVVYHYSIQAEAGTLALAESRYEILAGTPEVFQVGFVIDMIPSRPTGNYQRYTERLIVDGRTIPVASWSYEESPDGIDERLQVQLANVEDRQYIVDGDPFTFEVGEWDGSQFVYTKLVDTDKLENTQYNIAANNGPADTFTFTGASETEDLLNKAPGQNIALHIDYGTSAIVVGPPSISTLSGAIISGLAIPYSRLTFYDALEYAFVTGCGFASVSTNIPNFPLGNVYFQVGQPYASAVSGIYGMFNPTLSAVRRNDGIHLFIQDGTNVVSSAMPDPREVKIERATTLGINNDLSQAGKIGALRLLLGSIRFDFSRVVYRSEVSNENVGQQGEYGQTFARVERTEVYRDFYVDSNADAPLRSELAEKTESRYFTGVIPLFVNETPGQEDDGYRVDYLMAGSSEKFSYTEEGQLAYRYKKESSRIPIESQPVDPLTGQPEGGPVINYDYLQISAEEEFLTYYNHPREFNAYYLGAREIIKSGLVYYDFENTQLDYAWARPVQATYTAGNVEEGMTVEWVQLESYVENYTPIGTTQVRVVTTSIDFVSGSTTFDTSTDKIGTIARNSAVSEQNEYYLVKNNASTIDGLVVDFNMGELPLTVAGPLAQRILNNQDIITETVEFALIGIDTTLQKGMAIKPIGRNDEDLDNYVVTGRVMSGNAQGYSMRLNARSAKRN